MNYRVDWTDEALDHLAAAWAQAPDRQAVTDAQSTIDKLLARNPLGQGAVRSEGLYVIEVRPLRTLFEVSDADRIVTVVSVNLLA